MSCTSEVSDLVQLSGCPTDTEWVLVGNANGGEGVGKYGRRLWADIKKCLSPFPVWYVAVGDEGNSILLNGLTPLNENGVVKSIDLTGKMVVSVNKEGVELMPSDDYPTPKTFNWAGETPTLAFANDLEEGDQIKIIYQ